MHAGLLCFVVLCLYYHYSDVIMSAMTSQITGVPIVFVKRLFRRRIKKSSTLRVTGLCEEIHRWSTDSPHKRPVTREMFSFDDVIIMSISIINIISIIIVIFIIIVMKTNTSDILVGISERGISSLLLANITERSTDLMGINPMDRIDYCTFIVVFNCFVFLCLYYRECMHCIQ